MVQELSWCCAELFSAISSTSCTACGIQGIQPLTLDTSCQVLFCSLMLVLETYWLWVNCSYVRVDGILLPWYIFSKFIV